MLGFKHKQLDLISSLLKSKLTRYCLINDCLLKCKHINLLRHMRFVITTGHKSDHFVCNFNNISSITIIYYNKLRYIQSGRQY